MNITQLDHTLFQVVVRLEEEYTHDLHEKVWMFLSQQNPVIWKSDNDGNTYLDFEVIANGYQEAQESIEIVFNALEVIGIKVESTAA